MKTASTKKKWLPKHGKWVHFQDRSTMNRVTRNRAVLPANDTTTSLPVDCTGNASVSCPMLANDVCGDCGFAMCAHVDGIRTFGCGKAGFTELACDQTALISQYEAASGGDNGSDEPMLVGPNGSWITGIAGDPTAVVVDHLDVDYGNTPLVQYCIDQFFAVCLAWSVPDDVLQNFASGAQFLTAGTPDPANGHYTPLADIDASGNYRMWTWGTWCLVSPTFVNSVDPSGFVTFSALQFNKTTGLDGHGRHVSDQAAKWVALGGNASLVQSVVAQFPAKAA